METKFKFYSLWLSLICIIIFFIQKIVPGFEDLFILNLKAVYEYQIWRFLTSIFLHSGMLHLLYNLFALGLFGLLLEKKIGSRNLLIVFFSSGIIANLIAINFYSSSLGASGAIYGILGCLTILDPFMMIWSFGIIMPLFIASIVWIIGDLLGVFGLSSGNIGHIAHLSGVIIGILFGLFWFRKYRTKRERKEKINIPKDYIHAWEDYYVKNSGSKQ